MSIACSSKEASAKPTWHYKLNNICKSKWNNFLVFYKWQKSTIKEENYFACLKYWNKEGFMAILFTCCLHCKPANCKDYWGIRLVLRVRQRGQTRKYSPGKIPHENQIPQKFQPRVPIGIYYIIFPFVSCPTSYYSIVRIVVLLKNMFCHSNFCDLFCFKFRWMGGG